MRTLSQRTKTVLLITTTLAVAACAGGPGPETSQSPPADPAGPTAAVRAADTEPPDAGSWTETSGGSGVLGLDDFLDDGLFQTVYFDYDQSEIRPDQRVKLQANAQLLRDNSRLRVLVAGHCDERGTREYNMALGERRASSTMQYLTALGIPAERIEIISFGEEQPAAVGDGEAAWSQNRRAEFRAIRGGTP